MIALYFGAPGCGKSTELAKMAYKGLKPRFFGLIRKYKHCVANTFLDVPRCAYDDLTNLGKGYVFPRRTLVLVDEASIEYNNRLYKTLPQYKIAYFKKHRHHENDLILFSQSWDDVDITLRRLCEEFWYMHKIGPFTISRKISKFVDPNNEKNDIMDGYRLEPLWKALFFMPIIKITFRPKYYRLFDSFEVDDTIPIKPLP